MDEAKQAPPQPAGRVVARTVKIDVSEVLDLDTGYARQGWHEFLWLSGWRAWIAIRVLRALSGQCLHWWDNNPDRTWTCLKCGARDEEVSK